MLSLPVRESLSREGEGERAGAGLVPGRSGAWCPVPASRKGAGSGAGSAGRGLTGERLLSVPDRARRLGVRAARAGREEGEGRQDRPAFLVLNNFQRRWE